MLPHEKTDKRTGEKVVIISTRPNVCKEGKGIVLAAIPKHNGDCIPHFQQEEIGGKILNEYLCEYPDGSVSWVNEKHIQ